MINYDISIIGGGVIGGMIARHLSTLYPLKKILLMEKESTMGTHTSTRNSSVIHAGFYYNTNSIKAQMCKQGNQSLTQYFIDNKLPLRNTGKFLVPRNRDDMDRIYEIKSQGDQNGVEMEMMDVTQALKIEKYLKIYDKNYEFLYSPTTKVGDSYALMKQIKQDLYESGNVNVLNSTFYDSLLQKEESSSTHLLIQNGRKVQLNTGYIINCAGLHADTIAQKFDFAKKYKIWPIKGTYLVAKSNKLPQATSLLYPVPPLTGNFFLGIHTTLTVDGDLKIGPSISPALWREQYSLTENFNLDEFAQILGLNVYAMFSPDLHHYMDAMIKEVKKKSKSYMINEAKSLTTQMDTINDGELKDIFQTGRPGIRSQLFDIEKRQMVQDFIIEKDKHSMHLLNVASPGWTCSIPMAELVGQYLKELI